MQPLFMEVIVPEEKISQDTIVATLKAANSFDEILPILPDEGHDLWDVDQESILPLINKAVDLVNDLRDGQLLQQQLTVSSNVWYRLIDKMVDLAEDAEGLRWLVDEFYEGRVFECRNSLRKIFDKADMLSMENAL